MKNIFIFPTKSHKKYLKKSGNIQKKSGNIHLIFPTFFPVKSGNIRKFVLKKVGIFIVTIFFTIKLSKTY